MGAPYAWTFGSGYNGTGQAVAIVDTGVQPDHPFFGGRVVDGACFTADGVTGDPSAGARLSRRGDHVARRRPPGVGAHAERGRQPE